MARKKVIAYYLNEAERELILSLVRDAEQTASFIIGYIEGRGEQLLSNSGIIFNPLRQSRIEFREGQELNRDRGFFKSIMSFNKTVPTDQNLGFSGPGYYFLEIYGPMLERYLVLLTQVQVRILEFRPPDLYVVRIDSEPVYIRLRGLGFVEDIRLITAMDTPVLAVDTEKWIAPVTGEQQEKKIVTFDVLLHQEVDMEDFLLFLSGNNIDVAGHSGNKVRIYLLEDDEKRFLVTDHVAVREMFEYIPPELHNDHARAIVGLEALPTFPSAFPYRGEGQLIGIADSGVDAGHKDFAGRILGMEDWGGLGTGIDEHGHGTHVAGTVLGDGIESGGLYQGAAPGAKLYFQSLLNSQRKLTTPLNLKDLFQMAYDKGVRIHNNSWGSATSSRISAQVLEVDEFIHENRDMLLVFSAGNDGKSIGGINVPTGHVDLLSVGSPGTAKNVLTVGASRSSRFEWGFSQVTYSAAWPNKFGGSSYYVGEKVSGNQDCLAAFSSRGPADDLRIKPDIVAPGTDIVSARSAQGDTSFFWALHPQNPKYAIMGGTSMSTPLVTGCAAVIREYFEKEHKHKPSAALLKATIINGTRKLNGTDALVKHGELPNANQGFGLIDMLSTIPTPAKRFFFHFVDNYLDESRYFRISGQNNSLTIQLSKSGWIRICMAYTDYPSRALQNNLNLSVFASVSGKKWLGNESRETIVKGFDTVNNVEVIFIEQAQADSYTIKVMAQNIIRGKQDYALVITASDQITTII